MKNRACKSKNSFHSNNRYITLVIVLFVNIISFAQVSFSEGYFISNDGQRTNCLIKNVDWYNNPVAFEYKITENTETKMMTARSVKEFGVLGESKFVRFNVQIDRSVNLNNPLVTKIESVFQEEEMFLRVLVEGQTSLYNYKDGNLNLFFFKTNTSDIKQLVYGRFIINSTHIKENNHFRQQLWNDLKCHEISEKSMARIKYTKSDLVDFFVKYNQCVNSEITWLEKKSKFSFHITVRPGLQSSSLTIENTIYSSNNVSFDKKIGFRLGIEAEIVLPFNNNKWSIITEPTYQYFKSESETETSVINRIPVKVDYKSIEFPIGIRRYFFLNDNSKIFVNLLYVIDFSINNKTTYEGANNYVFDGESGFNLAFGIGYKFTNYSIEMRSGFKRELMPSHIAWSGDYKSLSLILGYTLF